MALTCVPLHACRFQKPNHVYLFFICMVSPLKCPTGEAGSRAELSCFEGEQKVVHFVCLVVGMERTAYFLAACITCEEVQRL